MTAKTVLVTGASGFVGSHLARRLVEAGHTVRAMTRHPDDYDGAGEAAEAAAGVSRSARRPIAKPSMTRSTTAAAMISLTRVVRERDR